MRKADGASPSSPTSHVRNPNHAFKGRLPISSTERVAIFIDGWNFAKATYEGLGIRVDFKRLLSTLAGDRTLLRAYYYIGEWTDDSLALLANLRRARVVDAGSYMPDPQDTERKRLQQQGFIRMLNRNGYQVIKKPVRVFADGTTKADLDIELAIDMLTLADKCDRMILVSGDSDFVPVIKAVGMRGVRIQVVGSQQPFAALNGPDGASRPFPARASDELLDAADEFTELREIVPHIILDEPRRIQRPFVPIRPGATNGSANGANGAHDHDHDHARETEIVSGTNDSHAEPPPEAST